MNRIKDFKIETILEHLTKIETDKQVLLVFNTTYKSNEVKRALMKKLKGAKMARGVLSCECGLNIYIARLYGTEPIRGFNFDEIWVSHSAKFTLAQLQELATRFRGGKID